jgi:soluble lytic murein transglycosylase
MPADIWVEMIPFKETRNYVRRVLFYTRIFEERLGKHPRQLRVTLRPYVSCGIKYTNS